MPYITREDGERFIIPSYRDAVSSVKSGLLKKEVMLLSTNYGEYIVLQKKSATEYEVAFSPDQGYLLGESVWNYYKKPYDMIYCEAIPNTTEALVVIVKSGRVYLDGSFQIDSIPEELVIFKTQQNNFFIYIYGDVPISEHPEDGKFSFDSSSVKSFQILSEPLFPTLPKVKAFQLQLVDAALKELGIGVLPIKQVALTVSAMVFAYMAYDFVTTHKKELPVTFVAAANPYQAYIDQLESPDPASMLHELTQSISLIYTIPGWQPLTMDLTVGTPGKLRVSVETKGGSTETLIAWAAKHNAKVDILPDGFYVNLIVVASKRAEPTTISPMQNILSTMIDRMKLILPDLIPLLSAMSDKKDYIETNITLPLSDTSLLTLETISRYIKGLPLVLVKFNARVQDGHITGLLILKALGN